MEFDQGTDSEWGFIRLTPASAPTLPTLTPYALTPQKENYRLDGVDDWAKSIAG